MKSKVSVAKWSSLVLGILSIIAGIMFIFNPLETTIALVWIIGILFIVGGILSIVRYFSVHWFRSAGFLIGGIIDIIFGILILRNTSAATFTFSILVGIWVLVRGIVDITTSIDLKQIGLSTWWLTLITGILGVLFGFFLVGDFGLTIIYVTLLIALYFIGSGVSLITMFFSLSRLQSRIDNTM